MIRKIASIFLLLFVTAVSANEVTLCELSGSYQKRLDQFATFGCYDKVPEFSVVRNRVRADTADSSKDFKARLAIARETLGRISNELEALTEKREDAEQANAHAREMASSIRSAEANLKTMEDDMANTLDVRYWASTRWEPGESGPDSEWGKLKLSLFNAQCYQTESKECEVVFSAYMENARYLVAMDVISDYVIELPVQQEIEQKRLANKQWISYFEDQQFQYWWEMNANFCFFNPRNPKDLGVLKRSVCLIPFVGPSLGKRWAQEEADTGFVSPPTQRFTYLHPDVGFMYVDGQPAGNSFVPALVFQWLGYSWWDGFNQDTGRMKTAKGVSLVSTVADLADADNVGIGLMAHYGTFALSLTRHSDDWAVYLNLNLLKPFQDAQARASKLKNCISAKLSEC